MLFLQGRTKGVRAHDTRTLHRRRHPPFRRPARTDVSQPPPRRDAASTTTPATDTRSADQVPGRRRIRRPRLRPRVRPARPASPSQGRRARSDPLAARRGSAATGTPSSRRSPRRPTAPGVRARLGVPDAAAARRRGPHRRGGRGRKTEFQLTDEGRAYVADHEAELASAGTRCRSRASRRPSSSRRSASSWASRGSSATRRPTSSERQLPRRSTRRARRSTAAMRSSVGAGIVRRMPTRASSISSAAAIPVMSESCAFHSSTGAAVVARARSRRRRCARSPRRAR